MNRLATLALLLALAPALAPLASADHHEDAMAEPTGFRADYLMDMANLEKKVVDLAAAVPADKYAWAPTPEVRNVAASYVHMAQANHQILQAFGVEPPEGVGDMEQKITEKDAVVESLKTSFAAVRDTVKGLSDQDLEARVSFFGREWSKRQVLMLIAGHCHEHLGQSIAYARSVGVVPPWSRAQEDSGDDGDES